MKKPRPKRGFSAGPYREAPTERELLGERLLRLRITKEDAEMVAGEALKAAASKRAIQPSLDLFFKAYFYEGFVWFLTGRRTGLFVTDRILVKLDTVKEAYRGELIHTLDSDDNGVYDKIVSLGDRERMLGIQLAQAKMNGRWTAAQLGEKAEKLREDELKFYRSVSRKTWFGRYFLNSGRR